MGAVLTVPFAFLVDSLCSFNYLQGILFYIQYIIALSLVIVFKRRHRRRICEYKYTFSEGTEKLGVTATESEWKLDRPVDFSSNSKHSNDSVFIYGGNSKGDCLVVRISRSKSNLGETSLFLKLSRGDCFELPSHPDANVFINNSDGFSSGGLEIKCLSPFRRWRIFYNGLLRDLNNAEGPGVHVKFSFIWTPTSVVSDLGTNQNSSFLAKTVIKHGWNYANTLKKILDQLDCYDHWGQYIGTISVNDEPELEVFLWGIRSRDRSTPNWQNIHHDIKCYGYMINGFMFHIGVCYFPEIIEKCFAYGYIILPNRTIVPINQLDEQAFQVIKDNLPDNLLLKFQAGKMTYELVVDWLTDTLSTYHGNDRIAKKDTKILKYKLNETLGHGILEHTYRNCNEIPLPRKIQLPMLKKDNSTFNGPVPLVAALNEEISKSTEVSGGKGSSLAYLTELMTRNECDLHFSVPEGVVITTAGYQHYLVHNENILPAINELEKQLGFIENNEDLQEKCKRIINGIHKTTLSKTIQEEIIIKMPHVLKNISKGIKYAVRSSAVGEDSEEFSAAGQMSTFLGLSDFNEICEAVIKCWGSQFSHIAVQYKRKNGQPLNNGMAVIIQEMALSEVSGVMFTCDPVTCNPAYITITANYGLGESVVSAAAEPDTIKLLRTLDGDISFHSENIGSKKFQINVTGEGSLKELEMENSNICCLDEMQAVSLGKLGVYIETAFGDLQDIEWAIAGGKIFLLQARPVTVHKKENEFELIHELDAGLLAEFEYLTTANVGEVVPGALSPLCISTAIWLGDMALQCIAYIQQGRLLSEFNSNFYTTLYPQQQRVFINMIDFVFVTNEKKKTFDSHIWEICLFGRFLKEGMEIRNRSIERNGYSSKIKKLLGLGTALWVAYKLYRKHKYIQEKYSNYNIVYDSSASCNEVYEAIQKQLVDIFELACNHIERSVLSSICNTFIMSILGESCNENPEELFSKFSQLLSQCNEVKSADVPFSLKELAIKILENSDKEAFLKMSPKDAYEWLLKDTGLPGEAFSSFIQLHGYRCVKEFDVYIPRWKEKPYELVQCIQTMLRSTALQRSDEKVCTIEETVKRLDLRFGFIKRKFLELLTYLGKHGIRKREEGKSLLIYALDSFRHSYLHLGKLMTRENRLPDPELIFFFTHDEIRQVLSERSAQLIHKAVQKKHLYNKLDKYLYPEITSGPPKPMNISEQDYKFDVGNIIKGTPASKGHAKGIARVVLNVEEASAIQPDDILITYSTDIGWTPYFPLLSGVVTELGGIISHGAVVAREYGLPCIVGAKGATCCFKSGDHIVIDGYKGILKKLDD